MMLEVGKLYSCSKYLLLYPDKETAAVAVADTSTAAAAARPVHMAQLDPIAAILDVAVTGRAETSASYWSKQFDKPVNYYNPQTPLLVLSVKEEYIQVLAGDKKGWIINMDWLEIKDIR
jgi:hypothetical protein